MVREFAEANGAGGETMDSIATCVSEAVTNVVVHAYRHQAQPGTIEVRAERARGSIRIAIRDEGHGLVPRPDSPGLGLGLPLISQLSSSSEIRSHHHSGTEVVMSFDLP